LSNIKQIRDLLSRISDPELQGDLIRALKREGLEVGELRPSAFEIKFSRIITFVEKSVLEGLSSQSYLEKELHLLEDELFSTLEEILGKSPDPLFLFCNSPTYFTVFLKLVHRDLYELQFGECLKIGLVGYFLGSPLIISKELPDNIFFLVEPKTPLVKFKLSLY